MSGFTKKRTLDAFFKPPQKKLKVSEDGQDLKDEETKFEDQVRCLRQCPNLKPN